jgi:hypothetical protein
MEQGFHYFINNMGLKYDNFNWSKYEVIHPLLFHYSCYNIKIINNELIETKKSLTKWERVSPIKHAWG